MTPLQIIVACCLGIAPSLAGVTIGVLLAVAYDKACDCWNSFVTRRDFQQRFLRYVNCDQVQTRQAIIVVVWSVAGFLIGGFAAGCYVESYLGLTCLLNFVPIPDPVC